MADPTSDTNLERLRVLVDELETAEASPAAESRASVAAAHAAARRWLDAEQATAAEKLRFGALYLRSPVPIVGMSQAGTIRTWNPAAERAFGWAAEEAFGCELAALIIPPKYRELHRAGLRRYVETGAAVVPYQPIRTTALRRDGTEFRVELTISPAKTNGEWEFFAFIEDLERTTDAWIELDVLLAQAGGGNAG